MAEMVLIEIRIEMAHNAWMTPLSGGGTVAQHSGYGFTGEQFARYIA